MQKNYKYQIDISSLYQDFDDHLKIQNNFKILFSGKFGIGKTYFLNEFFKSHKDYNVFHLFPINYEISTNEDILEYLKHDILVELLNRNDAFNNENIQDKSFIDFIKNRWNTKSILTGTIDNTVGILPFDLSKLGKPLKTILKVDEQFQQFKSEGDKKTITDFLQENNSETDVVSEIIKSKLEKYKQSTLVLDDLDRIDPDHIFRILNVFSAHFDLQNNLLMNKFGFKKIILVADYENLVSIFHHKYGEITDSSGYFDKFFSIEVFHYDNIDIVSKVVDDIVSKFVIEDKNLQESLSTNGFIRIFINEVLNRALKLSGKEKLNLRQLLKGVEFPLNSFRNNSYRQGFGYNRDQSVLQFINISIKALISIFGGTQNDFLTVLKKIKMELRSVESEYLNAYHLFSQCLLQKVKPFDKHKENLTINWNDYSIFIKRGEIEKVSYRGGNFGSQMLFYDLLTKYVEDKHYLETVWK